MHDCSRTVRHRPAWSHAPPQHTPTPTSHTHLDTQASKLQRQYLEGKHTDVVIRVRIGGETEEPQAATHQEGAVVDDGEAEDGGDAEAGSAGAAAAEATEGDTTAASGDAAAAATPVVTAADPVADSYTDIKAHALVLCTLSPYFDKALSGEWTEATARRIELTVEDEQALEDLKLLIKLS